MFRRSHGASVQFFPSIETTVYYTGSSSVFTVEIFKRACLLAGVVLLLAYSVDVGSVDLVPRSHIFLHAGRHAGLFAAGQGAAGFRDALLEAVLLEFLRRKSS